MFFQKSGPTSVTSTMRLSHHNSRDTWRATTPWAFRPHGPPLLLGLSLFWDSVKVCWSKPSGEATPWTVFAQGVLQTHQLVARLSTAVISLVVPDRVVPLRERPGFGTIPRTLIVIAYVLDFWSRRISPCPTPTGSSRSTSWAPWWSSAWVARSISRPDWGLTARRLMTSPAPAPRRSCRVHPSQPGSDGAGCRVVDGGTVGVGTAFFAATIGFSIGASLRVTESLVSRFSS